MKPKIIPFAFLSLIIAIGCRPHGPALAPEAIYHNDKLTVIASSYNKRNQTTSILYGNAAALIAASSDSSHHVPGEDYRLVTWEQHANPLWYGSNINGAIKRIERVTTNVSSANNVEFDYSLIAGTPAEIPQGERIAYILALKQAQFP